MFICSAMPYKGHMSRNIRRSPLSKNVFVNTYDSAIGRHHGCTNILNRLLMANSTGLIHINYIAGNENDAFVGFFLLFGNAVAKVAGGTPNIYMALA